MVPICWGCHSKGKAGQRVCVTAVPCAQQNSNTGGELVATFTTAAKKAAQVCNNASAPYLQNSDTGVELLLAATATGQDRAATGVCNLTA